MKLVRKGGFGGVNLFGYPDPDTTRESLGRAIELAVIRDHNLKAPSHIIARGEPLVDVVDPCPTYWYGVTSSPRPSSSRRGRRQDRKSVV